MEKRSAGNMNMGKLTAGRENKLEEQNAQMKMYLITYS